MTDLTVVIACAPYHASVVERARASVAAQSVQTDAIVIMDTDKRGAGWARNRGLEQVRTPLVTFLDADDLLEPQFTEIMTAAFSDGERRYRYSDWFQEGVIHHAPECAWVNQTWHIVTAVVPTVWAFAVGGFDERMRGGEDTDLYMRLCVAGFCGRRVSMPLVHYTKDGRRSKEFLAAVPMHEFQQEMSNRYGGKKMSCCGGNNTDQPPTNEPQDGDVLARALWVGNRQQIGRITGRYYPRMSAGRVAWVAPADVSASPTLWQEIDLNTTDFQQFTRELQAFIRAQQAAARPVLQPIGAQGEPAPDLDALLALYREAVNNG